MEGSIKEAAWTISEVYWGIIERWEDNEIQAQDVQEIAIDLNRHGGGIGAEVARKLRKRIREYAEDNDLCPHCFYKLEPGNYKREYLSQSPGLDVILPTTMNCVTCGYEREL